MDFLGFFEKASWSVEIIVFLAIITTASYLILRKKSPEDLTQGYLLSIALKVLLSGGFVIWFILDDRDAANFNTTFFLAGYVIFTAAEVIFLLLKKTT